MSVQTQINDLETQLAQLKLVRYKEKLINLVGIYEDDLKNVENFTVKPKLTFTDNENDEYSAFRNCNMELSYDYKESNNKVITVSFNVQFSSTQTYNNRYNPDIHCKTNIDITNDSDEVDYDYEENIEVINNENNEINETWDYLINKVLKFIDGEENKWYCLINKLDKWY